MAIFTLCDLVILTACVMISMVMRNPILKWLIILAGALNLVLPLITWMLNSLNL